nr:PREDICTED: tumor necrosis factor receptor superfamily member 5-like [Lepisosteus oculatus]
MTRMFSSTVFMLIALQAALAKVHPYKPVNGSCPEDEYVSKGVCCSKCKPGYFARSRCTADTDTQCQSCRPGTYIDLPNYASQCRGCRSCRTEVQLVTRSPCTSTQDTECVCAEGAVCVSISGRCEACELWAHCPPGTYTAIPGNNYTHPVCKACPNGTFNENDSVTAVCRNHTVCSESGKVQAFPGTALRDAVCKNPEVAGFSWLVVIVPILISILLLVLIGMTSLWIGRKTARGHCMFFRRRQPDNSSVTSQSLLVPAGGANYSCASSSAATTPTSSSEMHRPVGSPPLNSGPCHHSLISGGMTVNGNVFIYNGPVINPSPASSPDLDLQLPGGALPGPPASSPLSPSLSVEESSSPVQEQAAGGQAVQERGKEYHLPVEDTRSHHS